MTTAAAPDAVNPHYLDHVMEVAATHEVQASEDIYAGNGIKLLARGSRIDPKVRERLLEHKLQKPLEQCVEVVGGVIPARFGPISESLLERHLPLRRLCEHERALPVQQMLAGLKLSMPMQSLLTVYASHKADRLDHTVGVAMLALALARKLLPGDVEQHRTVATAGLVHDIGELYIDPAILRPGAQLQPDQWRHVVAHPLTGHRVLSTMAGGGEAVAQAVLLHHERLDGFGYPHGVSGRAFALPGQILAVAEWLMALVESDTTPLNHARLAAALMPGDFDRAVLDTLSEAARASQGEVADTAAPPALEVMIRRAQRIADTMERFQASRDWIDERIREAAPTLRSLLEVGRERMLRIRQSFASTGLDTGSPDLLIRELTALQDPQVQVEIAAIVRELGWRLRELEREQLLRAASMNEADSAVVHALVGRLKTAPAA